ncbi:type I-E CRISPR-associated protein Cse2/CasB [Endozoicomonas sp. ONNA2]|uniref:type I-E CRISPR-associated protein Cse2/CasB n=1 Tax=Endozoicomonas sp. ONNA2 TaxID=2828741 RepID=UPI0021496D83|nr:type I-E CRISPR-associated protein Cse2/CasB [Endozoicomonas sp. ONNA2]
MPLSTEKTPDFIALYQAYGALDKGPQAELRRVVKPDDLIEVPTFYRLTRAFGHHDNVKRLIFCLPWLTHQDNGVGPGAAFARAGISEKRLFMIVRSQMPNDLIQLRRLLQQVKPTVDVVKTAWLLLRWHQPEQKQKLLEDFFLHQKITD